MLHSDMFCSTHFLFYSSICLKNAFRTPQWVTASSLKTTLQVSQGLSQAWELTGATKAWAGPQWAPGRVKPWTESLVPITCWSPLYQLTRADCSLSPTLPSGSQVGSLNQPRKKYLHHGNLHPLQTRAASLGELAVKIFTSTSLISSHSGITLPWINFPSYKNRKL